MIYITKIIFASNNIGKYKELKSDFEDVGINLIFPDKKLVLPEDNRTLIHNAITKAEAAAKEYNMLALGDDSGIFIEALDYFPGVYSRRWMSGSDADRNAAILELMKNEENRTVDLISRFALVDPEGNCLKRFRVKNTFNISKQIHGDNGFGYDNILEVRQIDTTYLPTGKELKRYNHALSEILAWQEITGDKTILPVIAELDQFTKNNFNQRGYILSMEIKKFLETMKYREVK